MLGEDNMLEFIWQNKEWLFSGAGIAVIAALIAWLRQRNAEKNSKPQVVIHVNSATDSVLDNKTEQDIMPATIERISPVKFEMIKDTIEAAPPLQRDQVRNNFVDIKVEWDAFLRIASKDDAGFVGLWLTTVKDPPSNIIHCKVLLSDYKELGVLPEGSKIRIHGEIEEANTWEVTLKNVKLFFYDT
jgi:hypothetical protein